MTKDAKSSAEALAGAMTDILDPRNEDMRLVEVRFGRRMLHSGGGWYYILSFRRDVENGVNASRSQTRDQRIKLVVDAYEHRRDPNDENDEGLHRGHQ